MEQTEQVKQGAVSADWVTALMQAIGSAFNLVETALQPGIISAQAYFQQLLNAQPVFRDPFAPIREQRQKTDSILIYAGLGLIALLILAITFKKRA